jgi:hypothetical protein
MLIGPLFALIGGTTSVSVLVHGLYCQYICMLQVYIYVTLPVHLLLQQVNLLYTDISNFFNFTDISSPNKSWGRWTTSILGSGAYTKRYQITSVTSINSMNCLYAYYKLIMNFYELYMPVTSCDAMCEKCTFTCLDYWLIYKWVYLVYHIPHIICLAW